MGDSKRKFGGDSASIFAVLTAVAASACCIGPAILLALGIGGLGFASILEPYRPYFLILTAIFLGSAFYMAYRPLSAQACAADGACKTPNRRRMRTFVWIASATALLAGAYPYIAGARAETPIEEGIETVFLDIEGMTCGACANHIKAELEKLPDVEGAVVLYPEGEAKIELGTSTVSEEELVEAVKRAGYSASVRPMGEASDVETPAISAPIGGCCSPPSATRPKEAAPSGIELEVEPSEGKKTEESQ